MNYVSARETAARWGLSESYTQRLLAGGRVSGAKKIGYTWLVPDDAQKPVDPRKLRRQPQAAAPRYLSCGLLTDILPLPPEGAAARDRLPGEKRRAQYDAEVAYLRGDADAVKAYFAGVSPEDETYLCAANIAIAAAMSTGDFALYQRIEALVRTVAEDAPDAADRRSARIPPVLAAVSVLAPNMAPDWLVGGDFSSFPADALPMLIYLRLKYLQSVNRHEGLLTAAQTALSLTARADGHTLADIYLRGLCACALYALGRAGEAGEALSRFVRLCERGGFIAPLAEFSMALGGMLEIELKRCAPAFERAVIELTDRTLKNWLRFHNKYARDHISLILTKREYQLAVLLSEGKSYRQAAAQLCLSVSRIKNIVSELYAKLGIRKKSELIRMVD